MSTNSASPFALGRIPVETAQTKNSINTISFKPLRNIDPFLKEIDEFGKLDGNFNNLPYQKPRDYSAAYFSNQGSAVIANNFVEQLRRSAGESPRLDYVYVKVRKPRKLLLEI